MGIQEAKARPRTSSLLSACMMYVRLPLPSCSAGSRVVRVETISCVLCTVYLNALRFILAEILVLVGGAISPAPAVPTSTSTRTSSRMICVQEHSSPVNITGAPTIMVLDSIKMKTDPKENESWSLRLEGRGNKGGKRTYHRSNVGIADTEL